MLVIQIPVFSPTPLDNFFVLDIFLTKFLEGHIKHVSDFLNTLNNKIPDNYIIRQSIYKKIWIWKKISALQITWIPTKDHLLSNYLLHLFPFHQIDTPTNQKTFIFLTECRKFQRWKRKMRSTCSYISWSNCDFFFPPICLKNKTIRLLPRNTSLYFLTTINLL